MENLTQEVRERAQKIISNPGELGSQIETTTDVRKKYKLILNDIVL